MSTATLTAPSPTAPVSPTPVLAPTRREPLAFMEAIRREPMVTRFTEAQRQAARKAIARANQPRDQQPAARLRLSDMGFVYLYTHVWFEDADCGGFWEEVEARLGDVDSAKTRNRVPDTLIDRFDELAAEWASDADAGFTHEVHLAELDAGYRADRGV
jgi:hypothetical protein